MKIYALFLIAIVFHVEAESNEISDTIKTSNVHIQTNRQGSSSVEFGLNKNEFERYDLIMKVIRGGLTPNLDPYSTLGIEARNDTERRHYAELWVKQEYERTEKELKFQREVDAAGKRPMPNMLPVNMETQLVLRMTQAVGSRCSCVKQIASAATPDSPPFSPINAPLIFTLSIVKAAIRKSAAGRNSTAFPLNKLANAASH